MSNEFHYSINIQNGSLYRSLQRLIDYSNRWIICLEAINCPCCESQSFGLNWWRMEHGCFRQLETGNHKRVFAEWLRGVFVWQYTIG